MSEPGFLVSSIATDPDLIEVIKERMAHLRKSERKVAEVVLADPDAAMNSTVATLARAAGVL